MRHSEQGQIDREVQESESRIRRDAENARETAEQGRVDDERIRDERENERLAAEERRETAEGERGITLQQVLREIGSLRARVQALEQEVRRLRGEA